MWRKLMWWKKKDPLRDLLERAKNGETFAAARLMTLVVRGDKKAKRMVSKLPALPKETLLIGITGAGGIGKSTITDGLIRSFRMQGKTVGVVACDPVSTSGGSVLGDRIRMQRHFLDGDVFIRSLTQRDNFKGVTPETPHIIKIFGAMKKDVIFVETVGAGQENLGFKELVKIMIFITAPGHGDEIQLLKGGVIETADIIVVNQSDMPGADITFQRILDYFGSTKKVFKTNAYYGRGIEELAAGIREVHDGL